MRVHAQQLSVLVATLLLVGCGGGTVSSPTASSVASGPPSTPVSGSPTIGAATSPPAAAVDACALLTDEEILQATTHAVVRRTPGQMSIFPNGCWIELADDGTMIPPEITIGVVSPGGAYYFQRYFVDAVTGVEHVSGIGDDAVRGGAGDLIAVKGDTLVSVLYIGLGDGDMITQSLLLSALP